MVYIEDTSGEVMDHRAVCELKRDLSNNKLGKIDKAFSYS